MQPRPPHRQGRRVRPALPDPSRLAWSECLAMRALVHSLIYTLTTTPQRPRTPRRPS